MKRIFILKNNVISKTITMSYDNFESAIVSFLYATKTIPENFDVVSTDFGISLNKDGFVEFDIEITKPVKRHLTVVSDGQSVDQFDLFNTFEKVHVNDGTESIA